MELYSSSSYLELFHHPESGIWNKEIAVFILLNILFLLYLFYSLLLLIPNIYSMMAQIFTPQKWTATVSSASSF